MYQKTPFGTLADGSEVSQYTLINHQGASASFVDLGGTWTGMIVPDKNGTMADVLLGHDTVEGCLVDGGHLGEIVGRNANRIGGAKFTLNGVTYELVVNNGPNNLHSGPDFYRDRIWAAKVTEAEQETSIAFSLESPDGDQGYPGNLSITVTYTLTDENELKIHYEATGDQDTICNFTNHAYFNLAGHDSGDAMDQLAWIDADTITAADEVSIPTGELRSVKGTPMDFTEKKVIGKDINQEYDQLTYGGGYDHNWVLNHAPGELALSAKAWDEKSGRTMEVYTDLPGIQFYTANFLGSKVLAKGGVSYGPRQAYCFETQYFPDAINKPQFPSPILRKGEKYDTTTIYKFGVEK